MYDPDVFGLFAAISATTAIFVGLSTFRLEIIAQDAKSELVADRLFGLAARSAALWGAGLSVAALVLVVVGWPWYWAAVGALVFVSSLQLVGTGILIRHGEYRSLARMNMIHGGGVGIVQALTGLIAPSPWSLMVGYVVPRLVWLIPMNKRGRVRRELSTQRVTGADSRLRSRAVTAGASAAVNSAAGQVPILLATALYGTVEAGLFAMAVRVLVSPLSVIGQAASGATLGEVGKVRRSGGGGAPGLVNRAMRDLLLIGIVPCGIAFVAGPTVVPYLLGDSWNNTGAIVAALALGALAQFVVAPFSQLLNVSGAQRGLLIWDIVRFGSSMLAWVLPWALGAGILASVIAYSLMLSMCYVWLRRLILDAVRR
ncbi:lipopolysaccharide biosynthesis protein [Georgenia thermotolerans]|uniref:Oligosaccharide flippase family protein n=1 Tax=Georgenia thermotolerans TaxID=527326 RepID=A0A7J5US87_9MICO|nr:oligosaccharide flippase family protein [Georgenia thermotolerans]